MRRADTSSMNAVERLIALASTSVESYTRTSKSGKTVNVRQHMRAVDKMSTPELSKELSELGGASDPQSANRKQQIIGEMRKRNVTPKTATAAPEATAAKSGPEASKVSALKTKAKTADDYRGEAAKFRGEGNEAMGSRAAKKAGEAHDKELGSKMKADLADPEKGAIDQVESQSEARLAEPVDQDTLKDFAGGSAMDHLVPDKNGDMVFSPERQKLHQQILSDLLDQHKSQANPKFHVMGGGPASGKSVMEGANPEISEGHALLNADDIKAMLPEYAEKGEAGAGFTHEESSYLVKKAQAEGFHRRLNLTLDGTGNSSAGAMRRKISPARAAGYEVNAYYVTVDADTAVERAMARAKKTGRYVPEKVIRATHQAVSATFPLIMDEFDSVKIFDTSKANHDPARGPLADALLVGQKEPGSRFKVKDNDAWNQFLAKAGATAR